VARRLPIAAIAVRERVVADALVDDDADA